MTTLKSWLRSSLTGTCVLGSWVVQFFLLGLIMANHNNRNWNILNWNIRGINSEEKCNAVRSKIEESNCVIVCLQETKRQSFDHSAVRKMAPKRFNKFAFAPSQGASGGIFVGWNGSIFSGTVLHSCKFAITILFTGNHNAENWKLTTIYGPCQGQDRQEFMDWLNSLQIEDDENWMFVGDFNFYRSLEDRTGKEGICKMSWSLMKS
jgi:hypothetical protein